MGDADVLRFVHDGEVEGRLFAFCERASKCGEEARVGDHVLRLQPGADPLENRPKHFALRLRKPRLATESRHITIGLPIRQLPRIDYLLPFGEKEMLAEPMAND